ncbi:MAG: DUF3280 domain-containing protein [Treponema sp.]|jgi:TolB-like protein|nr:DUF3280 domain-containing protein [Treponema sp.]
MKKAIFCLFSLFICAGLFAQQPVVAVAPFDIIGNAVTAEEASMINDVFFVRLGNTRKVGLVNRNLVDRILREHQFQAGDWSNDNKTAELARALNADWIVQGNIRKSSNQLLIIVQFYDIKTFKFEGGTDIRIANADAAYDNMNPLVDSLIQTIASNPASTGQRQTGNTGASAYHGTWLGRSGNSTGTFIIEANKITFRTNDSYYFVISNCTWTATNNIIADTLNDFPNGFKVSGVVTDIHSGWSSVTNHLMPIYFFINKNDRNIIIFNDSPNNNSEIQRGYFWGNQFRKVQ